MTLEQETNSAPTTDQIGRRTVLKGAAWSVPVVAAATTLPMAAATCTPTLPPNADAWWIDSHNVHQIAADQGYNLVDVLPAEGNALGSNGQPFVRVYADAGDASDDTGAGWARGIANIALTPGTTYTFTYDIRASFGSQAQANTAGGDVDDPGHLNSFGTDVQGFIHDPVNNWTMPITDVYSTRADGRPGIHQIPGVYDTYAQSFLNNEAWLVTGIPRSFTIPGDWSGTTHFWWEFTEAARDARLFRHKPADSGNVDWNAETSNDDLDVTFPLFSAISC